MDEIEVPTEHLHETIHEHVHHNENNKESKWSLWVAISTALMAVLAAISSLFAGHHSNEAVINQIKSSDQWSLYQAKGIKAEIKAIKIDNSPIDTVEYKRYKEEQVSIKEKASSLQEASEAHLETEKKFAKGVTFFQIAIAISAISILTKRKFLWIGSLFIGIAGAVFLIIGLLQ
jgi:lipopolysaccharide export LptBFGC system permease protein LptF